QPSRLVALDGPGDPGRRDLADLELVPGRPRLFFGQAHTTELRIGEDGVGDEAAVGGEILLLDEIRVHDLVVVVGDVREGRAALDVPQRPDVRYVGLKTPVDLDEPFARELYTGGFQAQVIRVGPASRGDQQVGATHCLGLAIPFHLQDDLAILLVNAGRACLK